MPRKLPQVVTSLPPPPPSPLVTKLRQDWRWAGISQFMWTFADAFGIVDWDIEALEQDFDGAEDALVPDLVSKLLYSLTWNRQINRENAFENLRKQFLKRLPERNVLGTIEEPVEWPTLGLSQKVEILWQLCEWQLDDPARFRSLLKTEDDAPSWRVDPIGWDKAGNTYFLFDDKAKRSRGRDDDQESELSELTDEEVHEARLQASGAANGPSKGEAPATLADKTGDSPLSEVPDEPESDPDWKSEAEAASDPQSPTEEHDDVSIHDQNDSTSVKAEDDDEDDPNAVEDDTQDVDEVKLAVQEAAALPEDFIEWEAVCVTLQEWSSFPEQWAKSKDADEKALYRLVADDIRPQVLEVLEAKEQERIKQEAINNRKRSSRIATRELAKEEQLKRELAEREMEERMERMRQEETRKAQEEAELLAREKAREDRMRERQERLMARENAVRIRLEDEVRLKEKAERDRERRKRRRDGEQVESSSDEEAGNGAATPIKTNASTPGSSTQNSSWELRCEVCLQTGWNLKDEADTVCCDDCGRWQHVTCHDRRDIAEGRGIRDWEKVDFRCKDCEERAVAKRRRVEEPKAFVNPDTAPAAINGSTPLPSPGVAPNEGAPSLLSPLNQPPAVPAHPTYPPVHSPALQPSLERQPQAAPSRPAQLPPPNGTPGPVVRSYDHHPRPHEPASSYHSQSSHDPRRHYAHATSTPPFSYANGQPQGQQYPDRPTNYPSGPPNPHWERSMMNPAERVSQPPHQQAPYADTGYQHGAPAHPSQYPPAVPYYGREGNGPQHYGEYGGHPQSRGPGLYDAGQAQAPRK
ncbi:Reticulocyte-binding protein 2 a [Vanrija pseudolonga]|uniref:Reticulocyte-binding protein 2 a n=1 Tax=Vanrija pseudolonga TaxID=143232 RepID=A0AAF1BLE3_9TREE|nr:Reticulocyte-binding protein 2 a [Vanrija pseudolonga]